MFLVEKTGWSNDAIMEMSLADIHWWVVEAVKLHNQMNKQG